MDPLERLIKSLARLPGIGRRSAERMALKLVQDRRGLLPELCAALKQAGDEICCCSLCGGITAVDSDPCGLCTSPRRDASILCVVESPEDVRMIERTGGFNGRYHALMGRLSPMKGSGADDLRVKSLVERIRREGFKEVLLALSTDVEGESTAAFIAELLRDCGVKLTRIAFGLPAGSAIMYSDSSTLFKAIAHRTEI